MLREGVSEWVIHKPIAYIRAMVYYLLCTPQYFIQ